MVEICLGLNESADQQNDERGHQSEHIHTPISRMKFAFWHSVRNCLHLRCPVLFVGNFFARESVSNAPKASRFLGKQGVLQGKRGENAEFRVLDIVRVLAELGAAIVGKMT